jgi:hypothetical protein
VIRLLLLTTFLFCCRVYHADLHSGHDQVTARGGL